MAPALLSASTRNKKMTEFDYLSKKLSGLAKTVDKARRKKIIKFVKEKTGKDPYITSGHRHKFHKHKSINHELFGALDIAGDKHSEKLMNAIGEIGGRAIDERKAKSETLPNRNIVHLDLKTGPVKELDKMLMKMQGRKLKGNFDKPGTIRKETRDGKYPIIDKFKKVVAKKKLKKKPSKKKSAVKKSLKKNISGYSINPEQLKKLKKAYEGQPYFKFMDALNEFKTR